MEENTLKYLCKEYLYLRQSLPPIFRKVQYYLSHEGMLFQLWKVLSILFPCGHNINSYQQLYKLQNPILQMLSKICCLNTDLCKCHCCGLTRNKNVKLGYIAILLTFYLLLQLSSSLTDPTSQTTIHTYGCHYGPQDSQQVLPEEQECVRDKNIQIVFVSVCTLHIILFFCMFLKSDKVKIINEGTWLIKFLIGCVVAVILSLLVSTNFFQLISILSVWIANWTYIFQSLVFVDLVFALNISFEERSKENRKFYVLKAVLTVCLLCGSAILCYYSFKHNPLWISWANIICIFLFLIIALFRTFPQNSFFAASLIGFCMIIISFYIHSSGTQDEPFNSNTTLIIIKIIFLAFLLLGMLFQGSNMIRTKKSSLTQKLALNTTAADQDNRYVSSNKWPMYHLIMAIICVSIPAIFCWHSDDSYLEVHWMLHINKMVWWGSVLFFYCWSLIAMKIFPSDDFSELENYFREYELK